MANPMLPLHSVNYIGTGVRAIFSRGRLEIICPKISCMYNGVGRIFVWGGAHDGIHDDDVEK